MMNTPTRLSVYGVTAVLIGAGAYAAGSAVNVPPTPLQPAIQRGAADHTSDHTTGAADTTADTTAEATAPATGPTPAPSAPPAAGSAAESGTGGN